MPFTAQKGYTAVLTVAGQIIGKARDVNMDLTATEIDTTSRDTNGWRSFIQGLKQAGLTVEQIRVWDNVGLVALRDAFINGTVVAFTMLDANNNGFSGSAIVSGLANAEALDDVISMDATLKPTGAVAIVTQGS